MSREALLRGANILDPRSGEFLGGLELRLRDGLIAEIGRGLDAASADTEVIDLTGRFVLPGLTDSHYHLVSRSDVEMDDADVSISMIEGVINARDCVASGVTSVRDCGCRHRGIYELRAAIELGQLVGPTAWAAGRNPTGVRAPAHWRNVVVSGPEQMRAAVRGQREAGADWVKLILAHADTPSDWADVTEYLDDDEIAAAVAEAAALGIAIGAHTEGWEVAARAVRLGIQVLDHAPLISEAVAVEMARRGTFYVPTVWAFSDDAGLDESVLSTEERDAVARWQEEHRLSVLRAARAGVKIAAGSDSADAVTGRGVLAKELHALYGCGLSPREAIAAATSVAAELMGRSDEVGRIDEGLVADLTVLDADPFLDLAAVDRPEAVFTRGRLAFDRVGGIREPEGSELAQATVRRWA